MITNLVIERISPEGAAKLRDELVALLQKPVEPDFVKTRRAIVPPISDHDSRIMAEVQDELAGRLHSFITEQIAFNDVFMGRAAK